MSSSLGEVSLEDVAATRALRLDPHVYLLREHVRPFVLSIPPAASVQLDGRVLREVSNGINLPEAAYQQPQEATDLLYISVGALSQFALRTSRGMYLRDPSEHSYASDPASVRTTANEVLVTRSGTPGIAWPATVWESETPLLIPSGFLIRLRLAEQPFQPLFLAAVLNHPVWRVWTSSLAAGKRQRNLTQEHLAEVLVPLPSDKTQKEISAEYRETLNAIGGLLEEKEAFRAVCDRVIAKVSGLKFRSLALSALTFDDVPIPNSWGAAGLRIDPRYHRGEVRAVVDALASVETVELSSLLTDPPIRGRQPEVGPIEDSTIESRVVATVSVQDGQVVRDLTKATTPEAIEAAGPRKLQQGDVVLAMDGEGSIGKAAIFEGSYDAVSDSHVGILRLQDARNGPALACYVNSSLGQAQVELAISGATGQTQLSGADVGRILIPKVLLRRARTAKAEFDEVLNVYEAQTRRVRRRLCEGESLISGRLVKSGCLGPATAFLEARASTDDLLGLLDLLKPEMF